MRVYLHSSVFSLNTDALTLLGVISFAYENRHRIFVWDDQDEAWQGWLRARDQDIREQIELALEQSLLDDQQGRDLQTLHVVDVEQDDWTAPEPRLMPRTALQFLARPLLVVLENSRNDRDFILAVANPLRRRELSAAVQAGWVTFSGGGFGEVKAAVDEMKGSRTNIMRSWVMFDSDAQQPGVPSVDTQRVAQSCVETAQSIGEQPQRFFHQLQRRTIENYIPPQALCDSLRDTQLQRARAFSRLSAPQRWHYYVKDGLRKDCGDVRQPPALFRGVRLRDREVLWDGFGADIAPRFFGAERPSLSWSMLKADDTEQEIQPMIEALLGRL
ncbi:MAG: hypothetical protein ACI8S6_001055 [Myxococcota bacterium]